MLSSVVTAKTPEQILAQVSASVVGLDMVDANGKSIGQGSAVIIGEGQVVTACQVVNEGKNGQVRQSGRTFKATLGYTAPDRNLCQLNVPQLSAPPVILGAAKNLKSGQRVYAIGVPGGQKPVLSEGAISRLRPYEGSQYIHISAAISPGSSGGGLFNDQGQLIGILSRQRVEGRDLTFALPVDWIGELTKLPRPAPMAGGKDGLNWLNRALALEEKADWPRLLKLAQQEIKRDPDDTVGWFSMGIASIHLKQYKQAVHAFREAIRNEGEYAAAWHELGVAYANLEEYENAIQAYEDALRIQPENAEAWYGLGNAHHELRQHAHAIHAYRQALRIHSGNAEAWYRLGITYEDLDLYGEAVEAYLETVRIQPENAEAWYHLGVAYAILGERDKIRGIYKTLRKLNPTKAEQYFNTYILP